MPQDSLDNQMANKQGSKGVEDEDEPTTQALDEDDVIIMRTYGVGPYVGPIKIAEKEAKEYISKINKLIGVKESDTGLAPPSQWDLEGDKQMMKQEQALQVARVTKIIDPGTDDTKYVIKIREFAKFVVGLGEKVSATDIEESMRVGVDTSHGGKYRIQIPLPPKIDPSVTMMTVEEKPDVTYNDVGGAKEQLERLREVVEMPLLQPERFVALGIDPPKGVLLYGPPGTGKTLTARAVANRTDACFICVIGSELVQRYVGEGARMVRELFQLARTKKACILFIDEVDAIGGSRGGDEGNSDSEVQRTMLEIVNQLDGFDSRGNVKASPACEFNLRLAHMSAHRTLHMNCALKMDGLVRKPCPPSMAERPAYCPESSRARLDMVRALADHVSAVYFMTADCYETAEEEPLELLPILNFLIDLGDMTCYARQVNCYYGGTAEHHDLVMALVDHLEMQCLEMGSLCQDVLQKDHFYEHLALGQGDLFGEVLDRLAAYVAKLFWKQQGRAKAPTLATVLSHAATWTLGGEFVSDFDACGPGLHPRRAHRLDGEISDFSSSHAVFLTQSRILEVFLTDRDFGPGLPMIVNLGAGQHDPANCLLERSGSFGAVLFEIDPKMVEDLRLRFGRRQEVVLVSELVSPGRFVEQLLQVAPEPLHARFPALLKIDVDNGDCDYLAVWLEAGYLPLVIHMEIVHSYLPPEIGLSIPFDEAKSPGNISQQYSESSMMSVGCSLGAALHLLRSQYSLLTWSYFKPVHVEFVLTAWAQEQRIEVVPTEQIPSFWRQVVSYREVFHPDHYHGLELDPRQMVVTGHSMLYISGQWQLTEMCDLSAECRSVCTEAGMYAIRARRKSISEKDLIDAINKVIKGYSKFSATPKYMVYN
ncbi:RPT1A [Symbiodinium sp. CCMP2592]|nr:RPT1A [Symbiodinium sp. CCMP2592]